ncbi:MAG: UDP-glucose/GDP-mannose dehydrogenase family protein [Candidatus Omnitrophica bacterium]|nr:UDP-glucose/GDP-mannose dehydrogenase family protein [Candidatus Omnitrophota bacterium]
MDIAIVGTGYVGLVTGACFAQLGNRVICVDNDEKKIKRLKRMDIPIYEPGLEEMVRDNARGRRLFFSSSIKEAVDSSQVIFITVGTPSRESGEADLSGVEKVARNIAKYMRSYRLIVEKSTVPVETGKWVEHTVGLNNKRKVKFDIASNPEFLREGQAISDFMHPDRVVIGVESKRAERILRDLYEPLDCPIIVTDIKSAEIIKHASNSFLAAKISFINAVSQVCDRVGADVVKVAEGMGLDRRIGRSFLDAGAGYGGSCFPKDVQAFINIAQKIGYDFELLKAVERVNEEQKINIMKKIESMLWIVRGKTIAVLGLAFKPDTDDLRNAPSIDIIRRLQSEGAKIKAYDPHAMRKAKDMIAGVEFSRDLYGCFRSCDCAVFITEWPQFKELDLARIKKLMRHPIIVDGRNIYEPDKMKKMGFHYCGIGRR